MHMETYSIALFIGDSVHKVYNIQYPGKNCQEEISNLLNPFNQIFKDKGCPELEWRCINSSRKYALEDYIGLAGIYHITVNASAKVIEESVDDIIAETPVKQVLRIRWVNPTTKVSEERKLTEEQFRYLQCAIAEGRIDYRKLLIVDFNGAYVSFHKDGTVGTTEPLVSNCLSLNDDLAERLLRIILEKKGV